MLGPEGLPRGPLYREQTALRERLQETTDVAGDPPDAAPAADDEDRRPPTQRSDEGLL